MNHHFDLAEKPMLEEEQKHSATERASDGVDHLASPVTDRAPLAVSLRMILLLSIGAWVLIGLVIAWLFS